MLSVDSEVCIGGCTGFFLGRPRLGRVERWDSGRIFNLQTFTGQCIVYDSYCSTQYKLNLVRNLVDRAKRICSESKLSAELDFLKSIFIKNGYPDHVLNKILHATVNTPCHGEYSMPR